MISIEPFAWGMVAHALRKPNPRLKPLELQIETKVIDSQGHARRVYRGLASHVSNVIGMERNATNVARDRLMAGPISPLNAELLADRVWFDLDDVRWSEFQLPSGALITPDPNSSPESTWYAELILLHALTTAACLKRDETLIDRAKRGATYIFREIQPDHATSQPWAVHAMLLDEATFSLADFMLHSAGIQHPASMDSVSLLLLADALQSLSILRGRSIE